MSLKISNTRYLRGPNIWSECTIMQTLFTVGSLHEKVFFYDPTFIQTFQEKYDLHLDFSTPFLIAKSFADTLITLQNFIGCPARERFIEPLDSNDIYAIAVEYKEEKVAEGILKISKTLFKSIFSGLFFDPDSQLQTLKDLFEDIILGPTTRLIVQSAVERHIPYVRLTEGSLVQLGWGKKQRRILSSETTNTSVIAQRLAQDKGLTKELLYMASLPIAQGVVATTFSKAKKIAQKIGFPLCIKPLDGNQGRGVTVEVKDFEELERAFHFAQKEQKISDEVLIEKNMQGNDYRLLVVNGKVVAAARREPPYVTGDGAHSVQFLIDLLNKDPQRKKDHNGLLTKISIDTIVLDCLKKQSHSLKTVPRHQEKVFLRYSANLSTGGSAVDCSEYIHPEIASLAIQAAKIIGLDVTGIDLICTDISQPILKQENIAILELNAAPGLRMHLDSQQKDSHGIGKNITEGLFGSDTGRIPLVAITGTNGKTTTTRLIAHALNYIGMTVGMTCSDGIYVGTQRIDKGDCSGPQSARRILKHPLVDVAVLETARGGILREGLGFDYCDVAVVTNIGQADHLGLDYIKTPQDMQKVKKVIVRQVSLTGTAVLNGDDPLVREMASCCPGKIIYFSLFPNPPLENPKKSDRYVYLNNDVIIVKDTHTELFIPVNVIPLLQGSKSLVQTQNIMACISSLLGLNYPTEKIIKALHSFYPTPYFLPGRFNFFEHNKATILADYAHNLDSIQSLTEMIKEIPAQRRIVVTSSAGDRSDEVILHQMSLLGKIFDKAILYQDACQRGRPDGQVMSLIREGFKIGGTTQTYEEIHDEIEAITHALEELQENDFCLILIDNVEEALNCLKAKSLQKKI